MGAWGKKQKKVKYDSSSISLFCTLCKLLQLGNWTHLVRWLPALQFNSFYPQFFRHKITYRHKLEF